MACGPIEASAPIATSSSTTTPMGSASRVPTAEPRPEAWELFDLEADPWELHSVHDDPDHADDLGRLRAELSRLAAEVGDVEPDRDPRRHGAAQEEYA